VRALGRAVVAVAALAGCRAPVVGERAGGTATVRGPRVAIEDAWLDLHGHVVATLSVTDDEVPLSLDEVTALGPRFTLARLADHPADGLPAWESLLATGKRVVPALRPGGPDDPDVRADVRQPGYESPASLEDLGGGRFRYVLSAAVPAPDPDETLRVGVWLPHVEAPSLRTSSTRDFRPSGGAVEEKDTVLDVSCGRCHGELVVHEGVAGVRLCVTCHTWQNADPYTVDPAALFVPGATTPAAAPNPLELGRMLHRIHRGRDLPTVHRSTWNGVANTTVPSATQLPAPFQPNRPGFARSNPYPGRKYGIVGSDGKERVYARAVALTTFDPSYVLTTGAPLTQNIVEGGLYPRDLRDCAVCHGPADADLDAGPDVPRQGWVVSRWASRRICSGCHPEVWYQASSPAADPVRFPHPGGAQDDDSRCLGCHVTGAGAPKLYAPITEIHVPPARSRRYNKPFAEIVRVEGLQGGAVPKVTFRIYDRVGPLVPSLVAPEPAYEPEGLATGYAGLDPAGTSTSYVPRALPANGSIVIKIVGPTVPDYSLFSSAQLVSPVGGPGDPAYATSTGADEYVYTFGTTLPPGTTGSFVVGMEVRRAYTAPLYRTAGNGDVFLWPYTGENVNESAENVYVYVNTATGRWPPPAGSPEPVPRRTVVDTQKCLACHDRIEFHGGQKHDPRWCVTCHTYDASDVDKRYQYAVRQYPGGPVNVGATFDGVEERSSHFKVMMHRIHTSGREGSASLEGIAPYASYYSKAYFFDRGGYPGDLANCTLCHVGKTYLLESVPGNAPATRANEQATIWHSDGKDAHPADEPAVAPMRAACTGCHATGATFAHVAAKTAGGVETCAQCHSKGPVSVEVAHGLAPLAGGVAATFSSIEAELLVPRCATAACHSGNPPVYAPRLDAGAGYGAMVGVQSGQAAMNVVEPGAPERSYLVYKLRGDATSAGGSGLPMPTDGALDAADVAAIEAWIANGAPND
jgi:OmcA/MtrC family decaheme c-type cytochrome